MMTAAEYIERYANKPGDVIRIEVNYPGDPDENLEHIEVTIGKPADIIRYEPDLVELDVRSFARKGSLHTIYMEELI